MDDPRSMDVDEGLGCPSSDGQYRVLIKGTVGYCFAKRRSVNEFCGHPWLGSIHVCGQEPSGEPATHPHAEFDLTTEPVPERGVRSQTGMDDFDGSQLTVLVSA